MSFDDYINIYQLYEQYCDAFKCCQLFILKLVRFVLESQRMKARQKENSDLIGNFYSRAGQPFRPTNSEQKYSHFDQPHSQISPVKKNKIGDSAITNVFDQYAKSSTELCFSLSHQQRVPHIPFTTKNIPSNFRQEIDPESNNEWKNKYLQLQRNHQALSKKCESRTKQMFKLQQTVENQNKTIRQLQQQNNELNSRYNGLLTQNQRTSRWNSNNGSMNSYQDSMNGGQVNRFYVEELQRNIDNLQRQNRRLSDIIMRKVKNSFDY